MAKVRVPASAGDEITIAHNGNEPTTYRVSDGTVTVKEADLDTFLANVAGSKADGGSATAKTKE